MVGLSAGVDVVGGTTDELVGFVAAGAGAGAGVGVASALTLLGEAALVVLAFAGLLDGAGLADALAGDCLVVAAGTCSDIVVAGLGGVVVFAGSGSVAGAGLGLAFAPSLNLIGAALAAKLSLSFACAGCGGSSTLAFAAAKRSFQYVWSRCQCLSFTLGGR